MAIDRNDNVWYGTTRPAGYMVRVDGETHEMIAFPHGGGTTRGVAGDLDGNGAVAAPTDPQTVSISYRTRCWGRRCRRGRERNLGRGQRTRPSLQYRWRRDLLVGGLPPLYTYSDMTSMQLLGITMRSGAEHSRRRRR